YFRKIHSKRKRNIYHKTTYFRSSNTKYKWNRNLNHRKNVGRYFLRRDFVAQQGVEMRTIFKNAFEKYTINQSKMLRYADRRRKKEELSQFVKTISNLWQ